MLSELGTPMRLSRPRFLLKCWIFASLTLPLCFGTTTTIQIVDFDFVDGSGNPFDPTIEVGDTVEWVWQSGFHSTTSVAGQSEFWDSGAHTPSFTFSHTFTQVGTFEYYCIIHGADNGDGTASGQSGSITVEESQSVPEGGAGVAGLFTLGTLVCAARRKRA